MGLQQLPEKKPRPSFYSRLFSRSWPLPASPGGWIPHADLNNLGPYPAINEGEGTATKRSGDGVDAAQAALEEED